MEGAARVEATSFRHVRCGYFLLQGFVHQTAVLIVDQTLTKDHGWPNYRTSSSFVRQAAGDARYQQEDYQNRQDGAGNQPDFKAGPQVIPSVIIRGDCEVLVVLLILHESRLIDMLHAMIDVQFLRQTHPAFLHHFNLKDDI